MRQGEAVKAAHDAEVKALQEEVLETAAVYEAALKTLRDGFEDQLRRKDDHIARLLETVKASNERPINIHVEPAVISEGAVRVENHIDPGAIAITHNPPGSESGFDYDSSGRLIRVTRQ